MNKHLIIYAKRPIPRYAKTRVGSSLGMESSAGIYARILYRYIFDTIDILPSLYRIEISVASPEDVPFFRFAFPEITVRSQIKGDLGKRMYSSFQHAFKEGADSVVLTGSDIPELTSSIVSQAFELLETNKAVIGPATDGGYYLIGLRAPGAHLFTGIQWSSKLVLEQTEQLAFQQDIKFAHLPVLSDLDDEGEYKIWIKNINNR